MAESNQLLITPHIRAGVRLAFFSDPIGLGISNFNTDEKLLYRRDLGVLRISVCASPQDDAMWQKYRAAETSFLKAYLSNPAIRKLLLK